MSRFYTYVGLLGNNILYRGYEDGRAIAEKVPFEPTLYISSKKNSVGEWKSLYDEQPLDEISFNTIKDAKDFKEQYKDVHGFSVHGMDKWQYQYINRHFKGLIDYDIRQVNVMTLDIEVITEEYKYDDKTKIKVRKA